MVKKRYTSQGVHLFERDTGLNVLLDEVKCCREEMSLAPANISIALTNNCNRKCRHCFAPKKDAVLDYDLLIAWIDELDSNGCFGVGFGGGEPFLYKRIRDLCSYVHNKTTMACTITTNGDFLDEATLEWIGDYVDFLRVSSNGLPLDYEKIAKVAGRVSLGINYLLTGESISDLRTVAQRCVDCGVKEILVLPQITTASYQGVEHDIITALDKVLLEWYIPIRMTVSALCAEDIESVVAIPGDSGVRQYLHVSADGLLKKSSLEPEGVKIGVDGLIPAIKEVYSNENLGRI